MIGGFCEVSGAGCILWAGVVWMFVCRQKPQADYRDGGIDYEKLEAGFVSGRMIESILDDP